MTNMCYLARPLDLVGDDNYVSWTAELVAGAMGRADLVAYNPAGAFLIPERTRPNGEISWINRAALGRCRGMIVLFPERPSIGTGLELQMAQELGLPTLVITTMPTISKSWSLAGLKGSHLLAIPADKDSWSTADVNQLERALDWLHNQTEALATWPGHRRPEPLLVQLDGDESMMPTRPYRGDAGFDLYTSEETWVEPGAFIDVPCGVSVQLPEGCWGMVVGRSSTLRKHQLLVMAGVIDQGYRGPLFAGVHNLGTSTFVVKSGMRLAQLIPLPVMADNLVQVRTDRLAPSERGQSGFGSSGE